MITRYLRAPRLGLAALVALLAAPSLVFAAGGSQVSIQQIELRRSTWPHGRAYVNVIGNSQQPVQGLQADSFKIFENGSNSSSKVLHADTLETAQTGASIVVVVQASGAWLSIQEDVKKAVAAFVNGLGDKDQVAIVDYGSAAEVLSPFSSEKGEVAGKLQKLNSNGESYLLYDGLEQALQLFSPSASPGKVGSKVPEENQLPVAKAIILISDGRDNGSATGVETVIADAAKRRIPIHCIGHSELGGDSLPALQDLAHRTAGSYKDALTVEDISKSLTSIKDYIYKMYVIEWKTELAHDGKDHKIEIAMETDGAAPLRSALTIKTPDYTDWIRIGIIVAAILFIVIIAVAIYVLTRPKPPPPRFCPVCKREQMPDWEICLFCLKAAKARMLVQKGAQKGKVYPLVGKIVSIGSGPETNIRLIDGSISGKHAGVAIDDNKFEIVDLGSKNGVLVNGKKTPRRFLRNGDIITLGTTELKFESSIQTQGDDGAED